MVLATNWSDMWAMTGIGFGTVFVILLLLVLILGIFNVVAKKKPAASATKPALEAKAVKAPLLPEGTGETDDIAAVATALCLYFQEVHDEEAYVLTIHHHEHTAWHPEGY
jgi:hypothetical protein